MKPVLLALFALLTLLFYSCHQPHQHNIVEKGATHYDILIDSDANDATRAAAEKLQHYFKLMSGVELAVVNKANPENHSIYIGHHIPGDSLSMIRTSELKDEGFVIQSKNGNLYLLGADEKAHLYAVSTLLEEYYGCMFFTSTEEQVPELKSLPLPDVNKSYEPDFAWRVPHFAIRYDTAYMEWHKISTFEEWGLWVHTFQHLLNGEDYYEEHPEYFSLVNGKRITDTQLCLSNPDVIRTLIENLRKRMEAEPHKKYWSVSQNDMIQYCECDNCNAKYEEYGSISGLYVEMCNTIAREFPDKVISTLAYQYTRSAPKNIVPDSNVNIMFCSIECNRSMPLENDQRSADFVKDLQDWSKLTNNIFMWDYIVQFKSYMCPFPNFSVLQPNIQLFKKHNIPMMFQQGSGRNWSDLSEVKQYLVSKLLWDAELDADSVVHHFMEQYYGKAAPYIYTYHLMAEEAQKEFAKEHSLNIYGLPVHYHKTFLSSERLLHYKELMDSAENAVRDDSVYLKRVLRQRMAVDFAIVDIAHNYNDDLLYFISENAEGKKTINPEMMEVLEALKRNADLTQTHKVNERSIKVADYCKHLQRKVEMGAANNLLEDAVIVSKTTISPKYQVGGVEALRDAKFGGMHFSQNWLGYEGEDMLLEIDLKESKSISSVRMNFFRDNLSWVWLPKEIKIEASADGKTFKTMALYQNDVVDNLVQDVAVPFDFSFESTEVRYLRISAESIKQCPEWHKGWGGLAWIFVDELVVE